MVSPAQKALNGLAIVREENIESRGEFDDERLYLMRLRCVRSYGWFQRNLGGLPSHDGSLSSAVGRAYSPFQSRARPTVATQAPFALNQPSEAHLPHGAFQEFERVAVLESPAHDTKRFSDDLQSSIEIR